MLYRTLHAIRSVVFSRTEISARCPVTQAIKGNHMRSAFLKKTLAACLFGAFTWAAHAQFTSVDISAPVGVGSITTNGPGSYTVVGGGDEMWGTRDQGQFAYYTQTGDFDVRVRAQSLTPANRWSKAGLRLAESLDPSTMAIFTYVSPVGPTALPLDNPNGINTHSTGWCTGNPAHGGATGGEHETVGAAPAYPNAWIRMTRASNTVSTYSGVDGINWTLIQAFDMNNTNDPATAFTNVIPSTALFGFAVSSHNNVEPLTATAEFRDFGSPSNAVQITLQPVSQSKFINQTATFSSGVAGGYDFAFLEWRTNGVAIPGANSRSYTTPPLVAANNGLVYTLFVSNKINGTVATSSPATLSVAPNPQLVDVSSRVDPSNRIYVVYTKTMGASAIDPARYSVSGGVTVNSASFMGADNSTVRLDVSPLTVNSSYTVTITGVSDSAGNLIEPNPSNATFTHMAGLNAPAGLTVQVWLGTGDFNAIKNKIATCVTPNFSSSTENVGMEYTTSERGTIAEGNTFLQPNTENYGAKIFGIFVPPTTGNYQFALSADDNAELYLSTDATAASKVLLTSQGAWNGYRGYVSGNGNPAPPRPAPVRLVAGRSYYLEALFQEGGGGDHMSVAVQMPGGPAITDNMLPIQRSFFSTNYSFGCPPTVFFNTLGPIQITAQPASQTILELSSASFDIALDGSPNYSVQWYSNNVAVPGATSQRYSFPTLRYANGAQYYAIAQNGFSSATSSVATLTVTSDEVRPTMLSANGSAVFTNVTIAFSEAVNTASGTNVANYVITNSAGVQLAVLSASIRDNTNVVLRTAPQTENMRYTVVVNNVGDRAGVSNPILPNSTISFTAWVFTPGYALMEVYPTGGGASPISLLTTHPTYPNYPRQRFYITHIDSRDGYPTDVNENYGGRISGLFIPTNSSLTVYLRSDDASQLRVSPNENPANASVVVEETGCCNPFSARQAPISGLTPGARYYYEALWKEGGGGDYVQVSIDGVNVVPGEFLGVYANPDEANLQITQGPRDATNEVGHLATFSIAATATAGLPLTYQWYSNGVAIAGARSSTYSTSPLALADNGTVYSVVTIIPGAVRTNSATSYVVEDLTPPSLIGAFGRTTLNAVDITYSEFMAINTSGELANYFITNSLGEELAIISVMATGPDTARITTDPQIPGARYVVVATTDVTDTQGNAVTEAGNSVGFNAFGIAGQVNGSIFREIYDGIGGVNLPDLTNNPAFVANNPTSTDMLTTFNSPDRADNYGVRITGYIIPTETGNYTFRLQSDDQGAVYLSTDASRANASFLAGMDLGQCCVDKFSGTRSLISGRPYYFEALMKEGGGGDYIRLAWRNDKTITAYVNIPTENLAYFYSLSITQQPANVTVDPNVTPGGGATFTVGAQPGGAAIAAKYQWERSDDAGSTFTAIPGATGRSYTRNTAFGDNGAQFRAVVSLLGGFQTNVSAAATLTLTADTTKPVVTRVSGTRAGNEVRITFNEAVAAGSAQEASNYTLSRAGGGTLTVSNAVLGADQRSVILTVPNLGIGSNYTVNIANVSDLGSGNIVTTTNVSFQSWIISPGSLLFDVYLDLSLNPVIEDLTNAPAFPNNPSETSHIRGADSRLYYPDNSHEGYGGRMTGYFVPQSTANYTFYIRSDDASKLFLGTNSSEASKVEMAFEPGCCTPFSAHASPSVSLVAGQRYYMETIYKEGTGGDFAQVAVKKTSSPQNPDTLQPINGSLLASLADPVGASITITQQPTPMITTTQGVVLTLNVGVTTTNHYGDYNQVAYQWEKLENGVWTPIANANNATYSTKTIAGNTSYRALIYIPGATATSAVAAVTGNLVITWTETGKVLQGADDVTGPWTTVATTSPYVVNPMTAPRRFYRLANAP